MKPFLSLRMKYIVLSAVCSLLFVVPAFSQDDTAGKPSIAVLPFTETERATYGGSDLTDMLTKELAESGKFTMVEKSKTATAEPETAKGPKESIDPTVAAEIGRKAGSQFVVVGNVKEFGEKVKVTLTGVKSYDAFVRFDLRGVDAKTGKVLFTQTIEKRGVSMGEAKNPTGTYVSKGMQDAIKNALKDAVNLIVKNFGSSQPASK